VVGVDAEIEVTGVDDVFTDQKSDTDQVNATLLEQRLGEQKIGRHPENESAVKSLFRVPV